MIAVSPLTHTARRVVEWSACDPAGIVYYPRYFEMFDANTNELFRAATGLDKRAIQARFGIVGWPMVDSRASFHAPATYGDEVTVSTHVGRFGGSSIELLHRLSHADGRLIAEGTDTRVWVARDESRPSGIRAVPLPVEFTSCFAVG